MSDASDVSNAVFRRTPSSSVLTELGQRISALSGDSRAISFLFQHVSVVVQRFHSVLLRESFSADRCPENDL